MRTPHNEGKVSPEDKKRQVGSVVFSAEMLNQPIYKEAAIFTKEWFRYRAFEDLEHKEARRFLTINTKGTEAKLNGTDYIGLTIN